nr:hypothetical protein CFP56_21684 [Quercus suber]
MSLRYVSANYDTATFNVSQATFDQDRVDLVTMYPYQIINQPPSGRLSGGAIAGIVVGVLALLAIIAGLGWWLWRRRREGRSIRSWARNVPGSSVGATSTTIDVSQEQERRESHEEFYKPVVPVVDAPIDPVTEEPAAFKRTELDATTTVRPRHISYDRAELPAGSIRRASDQSRASRPSISPLDPRANSGRFGHFSMGSGYSSPPSGYGAESPPLHDGYSSGVFELHGHSRGPSDTSVKTLTELDGQQEHQQQQQIVEAGGQTPRDGRGILQGRWGESSTLEHHVEHDEDNLTVTEKDPLVAAEEGGDGPGTDERRPPAGDPEKQ